MSTNILRILCLSLEPLVGGANCASVLHNNHRQTYRFFSFASLKAVVGCPRREEALAPALALEPFRGRRLLPPMLLLWLTGLLPPPQAQPASLRRHGIVLLVVCNALREQACSQHTFERGRKKTVRGRFVIASWTILTSAEYGMRAIA